MTSPLLPSVAREVEFAADDHGKQNYIPLKAPALLRKRSGGDRSRTDAGIKHVPPSRRNWLYGLYFVTEVSGRAAIRGKRRGQSALRNNAYQLQHI
jgi:hypothetical protein